MIGFSKKIIIDEIQLNYIKNDKNILLKTKMMTLEQRYHKIKQEIQHFTTKAERVDPVKLLAISKYHSIDKIAQLYQLGQTDFGENYIQEAEKKIQSLANYNINWHFVGPIQSNKTKLIAQYFQWVHSVDRIKIAQRLNEHLLSSNKKLSICIQVNLDAEAQKAGVLMEGIEQLTAAIIKLPQLELRGLMSIPAINNDSLQQRAHFKRLKQVLNQLNHKFNINMDTLSMGMSDDMGLAILEGSTMVRVGTAIFGERTKP